ncbi:biopolymer transporter ExbD [Bowmanella sp. JS7-9]|uniref:ExbD/TolR family protein n=1 Tax=Pseudobowmanella zhangzhouensis TaxID=1537679 RepID=A0ABW1XI70_9ALTE|nr:biopolymer transporter ExbD [Bowmanella sp. JS7-9]TBX27245.1 biopolymer transporter ExbD [Bowmanella sp. JS7-9]
MLGRKTKIRQEAELDITSFMNLMIVLVPVLLMMMVFSRITVLELRLPELSALAQASTEQLQNDNLELVVTDSGIEVFFPQGYLLKSLPKLDEHYDYAGLRELLKQVKVTLQDKQVEKRDITLLLSPSIDYQSIVNLMDTSRAYPEVVAASVVQAELFPNISLGDAPAQREPQP